MPIENLEDQGLEKNPDLELAHSKFLLSLPEYMNDKNVHTKITEAIKKDGMYILAKLALQIYTSIFSVSYTNVSPLLGIFYFQIWHRGTN